MYTKQIAVSVLTLLPLATMALKIQDEGADFEGWSLDDDDLAVPDQGCCQFWHTGRFNTNHYGDP